MSLQELVKQIYLPPLGHGNLRLKELLGSNNIRFFTYGRYALLEGLRIIGVGPEDKVLIPEFICRDLLSSINHIRALPVYYPVDKNLELNGTVNGLPKAKAIVAVDYFGFPQNLSLFREYCQKTGAVLIEDNAHGLFSKDENGQWLGTRGDIGIFSLRKTIPMPDGAAFVLNNTNRGYKLNPQLEFSSAAEPFSFMAKQLLRRLVPVIGVKPLRFATITRRFLRRIKAGNEIAPSLPDAEYRLPSKANPCKKLLAYLSSVDIRGEINRRRQLYTYVDKLIKELDCHPVFNGLPDNVVPYGYPFYSSEKQIEPVKRLLEKNGLECFKWPELPDVIKPSAPEHYKTIWFVSFLW